MIRPIKGLAFAMAVLLLLGSVSTLADSAGDNTAAELSILLTTYLSPSGENYQKPLPEWIKAYFNLDNAEYPIDTPAQAEPVADPTPPPAPEPEGTAAAQPDEPVQQPEEAILIDEAMLIDEAVLPEPTPLTSRVVMHQEEAALPVVVSTRLAAYEPPLIVERPVQAEVAAEASTDAGTSTDTGTSTEAEPSAEAVPSDEELPAGAMVYRASAEETLLELSEFEPKSETAAVEPETVYATSSGAFSIHALNFLDTEIFGTGIAGAEVTVYVSSEALKTTVDADGKWKIVLPDWLFLMEGSEVRATQTEGGEGWEAEPNEELTLFVGRKQSMPPAINDIDSEMTIFSGSGVPNARITVVWPDASMSVFEPVMLTGYWGVETHGKLLRPGDTLSVIQQEGGLLPSDPRTVKVVERSPQPGINSPRAGDRQLTGTGLGGASISILSNAGFNGSATLPGNETQWTYSIPEGLNLAAGDVIRLYQKVPGRTQSDWLEITVVP